MSSSFIGSFSAAARKGYHAWRNAAKDMHAQEAGEMLSEAGLAAERIARVQALIRKEHIKRDADAQALEDICFGPAHRRGHRE